MTVYINRKSGNKLFKVENDPEYNDLPLFI